MTNLFTQKRNRMKKHKLIFLSIIIFIFFFGIGFIKHKENKEPILGGDTIFWKNNRYVPISGDYKEKNIIAKGKTFSIFNVGDNSNTFIGYSSFLDNFLYVKETYQIPKNGEITTVFWGNRTITDKKFYTILTKILENIKLFEKKSY